MLNEGWQWSTNEFEESGAGCRDISGKAIVSGQVRNWWLGTGGQVRVKGDAWVSELGDETGCRPTRGMLEGGVVVVVDELE